MWRRLLYLSRRRNRKKATSMIQEYSFDNKVVGDSTYPVKLYKGLIDPASPPAPTDPLWKEETSQAVIDKLKSQNELNITSVDTTGRTAVWNGQTLVQQGTNNPAVRDDFVGKTAGNTVANPHLAMSSGSYMNPSSSLLSPSSFVGTEAKDWNVTGTGAMYNLIKTLNDGLTAQMNAEIIGIIPQQLFSFNIIRMVEDKYGLIPVDRNGTQAEILARQIQWCKDNLYDVICNAYVYGLCPTGNKAYLKLFDSGAWADIGKTSTSPSPTLLKGQAYAIDKFSKLHVIDVNGFVHFLAYTDPARTTDSTLLVLTGHGLSLYDIVENLGQDGNTLKDVALISAVPSTNVIVNRTIAGQIPNDIIKKYHLTLSANAGAGTTTTNINFPSHGLVTGEYIRNATLDIIRKVTVVDANTLTVSAIAGQTVGDAIRSYKYTGTQTAEATVIPSTIYTDYVSLDLQLKATAGYDVLVPSNPRRDAGMSNAVQLQKIYAKQTSDFVGKISGSVVENGNKAISYEHKTSLQMPNAVGSEFDNTQYSKISIQDINNVSNWSNATANGEIAQQIFSFNLIAIYEKLYGTIPCTGTTTADKVAWLKANVSKLTAKWTGYGSCPSGNRATLSRWGNISSSWIPTGTTTNSSPTLISGVPGSVSDSIDSNGFVHFLAYTDASDGVTASTIYTDYISLDIEYNAPNNSVEYFTNNSVDLDSLTNAKAPAYMVEVDMTAICNAVAGGSNAAFKALLKAINVDAWAMGQGANAGVMGYGVKKCWWYNQWYDRGTSNTTSTIAKITDIRTTTLDAWVTSANKMYILITTLYSSDGTIASSCVLDYIKIKVTLN